MDFSIDFKVNRLPELYGVLNEEMNRAAYEVGERMYDTAYELVPVDTGDLRRSLYVKQEPDGTVTVGAAEEYAGYVELGTRHQAPQPYLYPAYMQHRDEVTQIVEQKLRELFGG